jgi:hypothetical protein
MGREFLRKERAIGRLSAVFGTFSEISGTLCIKSFEGFFTLILAKKFKTPQGFSKL